MTDLAAEPPSTTPSVPPIHQFHELRSKVFGRRPVLGRIAREQGATTLFAYATQNSQVPTIPVAKRRQQEFLATFHSEVSERLGGELATKATRQLEYNPIVSTADHHGPLCHPFFLSSNILAATPSVAEAANEPHEALVVLSCANVSLNNSSFPRGLLFQSPSADEGATLQRVSFFPAKDRLCSVYGLRPYTNDDLDRAQRALAGQAQAGTVAGSSARGVHDLIEAIYRSPQALNAVSYDAQVTVTNQLLWRQLFQASHARLPELITFEQEWLVAKLLMDYHFDRPTSIHRLLFNPASAADIDRFLDGLEGGFRQGPKTGSYLFWAVPPQGKYRVQLWRHGDELRSDDGSYRIALTPEALRGALERKELLPSMLLTFIVLAFYYGITCEGGFCQVNYLPAMKRAYLKLLEAWGAEKDAEICRVVATEVLCGDFTFTYLRDALGQYLPATSLDLILYGNQLSWGNLVALSKEITLDDGLNPMMPEFYQIMYLEAERARSLSAITSRDIVRATGLWEKLRPAAIMDHALIH